MYWFKINRINVSAFADLVSYDEEKVGKDRKIQMDAYFERIKNEDPNKMIDTCKLKIIQYQKTSIQGIISCILGFD